MKKITLLASLALAFSSLTANAFDKVIVQVKGDRVATTLYNQASTLTAATTADGVWYAYNGNNGGRRVSYNWGKSVWTNVTLPESGYKFSVDFALSTVGQSKNTTEPLFFLLPVGSGYAYSTADYTGTDYIFKMNEITGTGNTAAGASIGTVQFNDEVQTDGTTAVAYDWIIGTVYNITVQVANQTATYTITNTSDNTVVATGSKDLSTLADTRMEGFALTQGKYRTNSFQNLKVTYYTETEPAEDPTVDLIWVNGKQRCYMAKFAEHHTLHWNQLGNATDLISGDSYNAYENYEVAYEEATDTKGFEEGDDKGQKIIYCEESGKLTVYATNDNSSDKSSEIVTDVTCEEIQLPEPTAAITNVSAGYNKEYTFSVDNSNIPLKPTITIMYSTDNGATWNKGASGDAITFGQGSLQFYSMDATHPTECYTRSATTTINNNVKYVEYSTTNYDYPKADVEAGKDGFTATTLTDSGNKSHWDRIYSDQWYGYDADGNATAITSDDGSWAYTKKGFGYYAGSAIGTTDATWPVLQTNANTNDPSLLSTAFAPLVLAANGTKTVSGVSYDIDNLWYIFPQEGIVSYQTQITNVNVSIQDKYTSDDPDKPNFYIITKVSGYDRPDKGNCVSTVVVQAGVAYSLYRYDTAIKSVRIMTHENFTPTAINTVQGVANNEAAAPVVKKIMTANGFQIVKDGKKFNAAGAQLQ